MSRNYVTGWSLVVIACCGNGTPWMNGLVGLIGLAIVWRCDFRGRG